MAHYLGKMGIVFICITQNTKLKPTCFCTDILEQMDRLLPNFLYALTLTRSRLGLLHIVFLTFVIELWPLIDIRISFPLNILMTINRISTNFILQDLGWDCYLSFLADL